MSTTDTLQTLKEILDEVAQIPADEVSMDSDYVTDLELDSLSIVSVFVLVKRKLGVDVPNDEFDKLPSVGKTVAYVDSRKQPA